MKKYLTPRNIVYTILIVFVGLQFLRVELDNPEVDKSIEFATIANPPADVQQILKAACYDCHSHETVYPWYSHVAPVSWIIGDHVHVGRDELNFSVWGEYSVGRQDHKLEEMIEEVEEGEMPEKSYVIMHAESDLTEEQKETLFSWIRQYRETLDVPEE
jgi:cytochrome c551/c552